MNYYNLLLSQYQPYSKEEQQEMFKKYQETQDDAILQEIVLHNIHLIRKTIRKYGTLLDFDDLMQEGLIATMNAAKHYDPEKGAFSTLAVISIERRIGQVINKQTSEFSFSITAKTQYHQYEVCREERPDLSGDALFEYITKEKNIEMSRETFDCFVLNHGFNCISLSDKPKGSDEDMPTFEEIIPDKSETLDKLTTQQSMHKDILKKMRFLTDKEQMVIKKHFGLEEKQMELKDIADEMQISYARAQALEGHGLRKLRRHMNEDPCINEYTYVQHGKRYLT